MRIGTFLKQSLVDWEGKIAAVVFTKGCNLRCFYCHNPSLVLPELLSDFPDINTEEILKHLESRKSFLDGVVITGGEPTLQKNLKEFIIEIKKIPLAIKLDTNGTNSKLIKELLEENLIDFIAMDIKNSLEEMSYKKISSNFSKTMLDNIIECADIIKNSNIPFQFRTTTVTSIHSAEIIEDLQKKFSPLSLQEERKLGKTLSDFL